MRQGYSSAGELAELLQAEEQSQQLDKQLESLKAGHAKLQDLDAQLKDSLKTLARQREGSASGGVGSSHAGRTAHASHYGSGMKGQSSSLKPLSSTRLLLPADERGGRLRPMRSCLSGEIFWNVAAASTELRYSIDDQSKVFGAVAQA